MGKRNAMRMKFTIRSLLIQPQAEIEGYLYGILTLQKFTTLLKFELRKQRKNVKELFKSITQIAAAQNLRTCK